MFCHIVCSKLYTSVQQHERDCWYTEYYHRCEAVGGTIIQQFHNLNLGPADSHKKEMMIGCVCLFNH